MRKINAILSLLTTLLLFDHASFNTVRMLSGGTVEESADFMPWIFLGFMLMHAIVSIGLLISTRAKNEKQTSKAYVRFNAATLVQRFSGVALIVLAGLHAVGTSGLVHFPGPVYPVLHVVFFTVAFAHVAISTSKALITLGIGNAKFVRVADIVIKVICAAMLIAALAGVFLYKA
jgi:hypothetical protein